MYESMMPWRPFFQAGESFLAVLLATASTYGVITSKNSPKLASESPVIVPGAGIASSGTMP